MGQPVPRETRDAQVMMEEKVRLVVMEKQDLPEVGVAMVFKEVPAKME